MVGRNLSSYPAEPARSLIEVKTALEQVAIPAPVEPLARKEASTRDALQNVVRDNPDITAGILEEWLDRA